MVLAQFANQRSLAQQRYAQFVTEGIKAASPWANLKGQIFLDSEQFIQKMQTHPQPGKDDVQIPLAQRRPRWHKSKVARKTEMQPSWQLMQQEGILTNKSPVTLGYTSRQWGKSSGAENNAGDTHLFYTCPPRRLTPKVFEKFIRTVIPAKAGIQQKNTPRSGQNRVYDVVFC